MLINIYSTPHAAVEKIIVFLFPSTSTVDSFIFALSEISIWNWLVLVITGASLGLWLYGFYLEFDPWFVPFVIRLAAFLFAVWIVLLANSAFALLLCWEVVGFISFLLIGSWVSRTWTVSSAFSAIGFNRVGDVALLWVLTICLGISCSNHFTLSIFIFALCLKSVSALAWLWLPEAMEGPTPVSSLLHSCTLVMAGLFTAFNAAHEINFTMMTIFISSLILLACLSRPEQDAKRVVATSTVVMVGFLWLVLQHSFSGTAAIVCAIHAAYKSAFFCVVGRLLAQTLTYHDSQAIAGSSKSLLVAIAFFLIAPRTSAYAAAKHSIDTVQVIALSQPLTGILVSLGLLFVWIFCLRLLANSRVASSMSINDLIIPSFVLVLLGLSSWILSSSSTGDSSLVTWLALTLMGWSYQSGLNLGSVSCTTGNFTSILPRYGFLSFFESHVASW